MRFLEISRGYALRRASKSITFQDCDYLNEMIAVKFYNFLEKL